MFLLAPPVVVTIDPAHVLNTFIPSQVLGGAIDGQDKGGVTSKLSAKNVKAMMSMGLGPLSYRLRTELGSEAWHWNPQGTWSSPAQKEGYWTSDSKPGARIDLCWGYRLPRRGNTIDQANNDGYSRIDDGSLSTYWKSNPYLDPYYTHEPEANHPQWVTFDFQDPTPVNALRIRWANPYATRFQVQYWDGDNGYDPDDAPTGVWKSFPVGTVQSHGGVQFCHLDATKSVRFLRVILLQSSHTKEEAVSHDHRDSLGYAIREVEVGLLANRRFQDAVKHRTSKTQTTVYTSSTDPWHRASDRDPTIEQPGFDRVYHSGLTMGQAMLAPVSLLYDTPDNAAAEIEWLKRRKYPVRGIEMGEEPDGQHVMPEDYAALYRETAAKIRTVDKKVLIGGPSLQTIETDSDAWSGNRPDRGWTDLFLDSLKKNGGLGNFQFFSFEWYPFDFSYLPAGPQLSTAAAKFAFYLQRMRATSLPTGIPWIISEYGYSAFAGPSDVQVPSAILNVDSIATFLAFGGGESYLYGYEPDEIISERPGYWGNLMSWLTDDDSQAKYPMPIYWASRMMSFNWCEPGAKKHRMLGTDVSDSSAITAYTVKRPDGRMSVLLVNRDPSAAQSVEIHVGHGKAASGKLVRWGSQQFSWPTVKPKSFPSKSLPPQVGEFNGTITLPPYTVAVALLRPD